MPRLARVAFLALMVPVSLRAQTPARYDTSLFRALAWRPVGPFRGGRVTAVAGVVEQPLVYYLGATGGGVWKTVDGGLIWQPASDKYLTAGSIDRRRKDLGEDRARGRGPDRPHRRASRELRPRVRRCPGACVRAQCHTGRLPLQGRRSDVGQSALQERQYRGDRARDGSHQSTRPVRRVVAGRPPALGARFGWRGERHLEVDRWRGHVARHDAAPRVAAGDHRENRARGLAAEPRSGLGTGRGGLRGLVSIGRRRRDVDPNERRQRDPPARLVLHARVR